MRCSWVVRRCDGGVARREEGSDGTGVLEWTNAFGLRLKEKKEEK